MSSYTKHKDEIAQNTNAIDGKAKIVLGLLGGLIILAGFGFYATSLSMNKNMGKAMDVKVSSSVTASSVTKSLASSAASQIVNTPRVQTFTPESLATHSTDSSCYVAVASKVYDVTAYISEHPGGEKNILKGCGRVLDGMRHPGGGFMSDQVQSVLKGYEIGELK